LYVEDHGLADVEMKPLLHCWRSRH